MATTISSILRLPPELILEISDHLPPDAILSLKFTHPRLNETLPLAPRLKNTTLTDCARLAIRTYLSDPNPTPSHKRCIFCKAVYPNALFKSSSSPACLPTSPSNASHSPIVELPDRFCSWHVRRLAKVIDTGAGGQNKWVSQMKDMCMHCGVVHGWSNCECRCDSCGVRKVRTYTRYLNNSKECRQFWFWRDSSFPDSNGGNSGAGKLFVRETCFDIDAKHPESIINLPVYYEDDVE